jgi:hypothetical protein
MTAYCVPASSPDATTAAALKIWDIARDETLSEELRKQMIRDRVADAIALGRVMEREEAE